MKTKRCSNYFFILIISLFIDEYILLVSIFKLYIYNKKPNYQNKYYSILGSPYNQQPLVGNNDDNGLNFNNNYLKNNQLSNFRFTQNQNSNNLGNYNNNNNSNIYDLSNSLNTNNLNIINRNLKNTNQNQYNSYFNNNAFLSRFNQPEEDNLNMQSQHVIII